MSRLAIVGPIYPLRGGIAHYTALLARELGRQHAVRVYGFARQYPAWLFPGRSQLDPGAAPIAMADARHGLVPWLPWTWRQAVRDWVAWRPDAVVVQWWTPFMAPMTAALSRAARRLGLPVIAICHNVLPHDRNWFDAAWARLGLGWASACIIHGESEARALQALLPGRPSATVAMPRYAIASGQAWSREGARAALALSGQVLLFFGFVRPYKGLFDLFEALPAVLRQCDVKLLVVGEVWGQAAPYHECIRRLGLDQRVRLVDRYVSNDEAAKYFAAADLAVLPYRSATGSAAVQLAFAFGLPVVATRVGSMAEAVTDGVTGYLVEPGDVAGLAAAITRFFAEDRGEAFRAAIQLQNRLFGWDRIEAAILQLARQAPADRSSAADPL